MDTNQGQNTKKITVGLIMSWAIGTLAFASGITMLFTNVVSALLMFLVAAVLLPPANKLIKEKLHFSLSGGLKFVVVVVLLVIAGVVGSKNLPTSIVPQPQEGVIQPAKIEKIPAPPLSAYPNKDYDLVFFYADGKSIKFQAPANYTDITVMIDGDVVPLGDAKTNNCGDIFAFLYDQSSGLLTACKSYKSGTNILFRGISKPAQLRTQQPKLQPPTISLPKYEKIPYGVAQNSILVSPPISIEQLKLLISELPKKLCSNPKVCLVNIYDDAYAARTDVDLTDEFLDFAEKHFIGQYSSYGGSGGNPIRRYRVNGQWVNF